MSIWKSPTQIALEKKIAEVAAVNSETLSMLASKMRRVTKMHDAMTFEEVMAVHERLMNVRNEVDKLAFDMFIEMTRPYPLPSVEDAA